jgi:hypothetical protein
MTDEKIEETSQEHTESDVDKVMRRRIEDGWPPALAKSLVDEFDYWCGLRNGKGYYFVGCDDHGNGWVTLREPTFRSPNGAVVKAIGFGRGMQVRVSEIVACADVSEIVACADAPHGS